MSRSKGLRLAGSFLACSILVLALSSCGDGDAKAHVDIKPLPAAPAPTVHLIPQANDTNARAAAIQAASKFAEAKYPGLLSMTDPIANYTDITSERPTFTSKAVPMQYMRNQEMSKEQREAFVAQQHQMAQPGGTGGPNPGSAVPLPATGPGPSTNTPPPTQEQDAREVHRRLAGHVPSAQADP